MGLKEESFKLHDLAAIIGRKELENIPRRFGYELTTKAVELLSMGKDFRYYLKKKVEKEVKQTEKEEMEREHRALQIEDLKEKLKVMNKAQLQFWNEQKTRNRQLTLIAIISGLFSLVALLKVWGIL